MLTCRTRDLGCKLYNGRYCSGYYYTVDKDFGVKISADMKASVQCYIAVSMGNQIIGLIRRNITYKEKKLS